MHLKRYGATGFEVGQRLQVHGQSSGQWAAPQPLGPPRPAHSHALCANHSVRRVNLDLPGKLAPSVISDNYWGAQQFTLQPIERASPLKDKASGKSMQPFPDAVVSITPTANNPDSGT